MVPLGPVEDLLGRYRDHCLGSAPDTLVATGTQTIADPPGAAVTFVSITWSRNGAQALVEAIHDKVADESAEASGASIYTLQSGRLTTVTTTAYGLTW